MVLLNLKTRRYFGISEVGKYIWEQLLEGASHQEICDRVAQKYGKQSFEVCADVDAFVHSLIAHELVAVGG